jgi:hypothetical protein
MTNPPEMTREPLGISGCDYKENNPDPNGPSDAQDFERVFKSLPPRHPVAHLFYVVYVYDRNPIFIANGDGIRGLIQQTSIQLLLGFQLDVNRNISLRAFLTRLRRGGTGGRWSLSEAPGGQ